MDPGSPEFTVSDESLDEEPNVENSQEKSESVYRRSKKSFHSLKKFVIKGNGLKPTRAMIDKEIEKVMKATKKVIAQSEKLIKSEFDSLEFEDSDRFGSFSHDHRGEFVRIHPFSLSPTSLPVPPETCSEFEKKIKASRRRRGVVDTSFFELIETNLTAEDVLQLTHLPLVIEKMDDDSVGEALYEHYPNGIHGYNWNELEINYEMLYITMKHLLLKITQPDLLYYALYCVFPNYGGQEDFSEMFPKLVEQFDGVRGLLALEHWKAEKKEGELFDVANPFARKSYIVKTLAAKSTNWDRPCSENCFKSLKFENLTSFMREIVKNDEDGQIVLYIKKSVPKTSSSFLNALLNNKDETITLFCETAQKFGKNDCADSFKILLGNCIPKNKLRDSVIDNYKKRDQRFRTAMKKTHDQLALKEETLELICSMTSCSHLGPCGPDVAECNCDLMCTIYCDCDENCARKFVGCQCQKGQCKTSVCPCFKIGYECNELTCGHCVKDDVTCKNRAITHGISKRVAVRKSKIAKAGSGLFMEETAEKGDYLGEYTGEMISDSELERRGAVDKLSISYTFTLGSKKGLDSSRAGNLFRYANHSEENPNCHVLFRNVYGKARIGFWASQKLKIGEELFFDYCYDAEHVRTFFEMRPEDRVKKVKNWPEENIEKIEKKEKKRKSDGSSASSSPEISELMHTQTRSGRISRRRTIANS